MEAGRRQRVSGLLSRARACGADIEDRMEPPTLVRFHPDGDISRGIPVETFHPTPAKITRRQPRSPVASQDISPDPS